MPVVVKYICDYCGKSHDSNDQMWELSIFLRNNSLAQRYIGQGGEFRHKQLWCRGCCANVGIAFEHEAEAPKLPTPPTLEDMLREIIRDEIQDAKEN